MENSIFAKFARGEIKPDKVRYEDDEMLAFDPALLSDLRKVTKVASHSQTASQNKTSSLSGFNRKLVRQLTDSNSAEPSGRFFNWLTQFAQWGILWI